MTIIDVLHARLFGIGKIMIALVCITSFIVLNWEHDLNFFFIRTVSMRNEIFRALGTSYNIQSGIDRFMTDDCCSVTLDL